MPTSIDGRALLDDLRPSRSPGRRPLRRRRRRARSRRARSRVREWQIVTVAFACRSSSATGLPTMSLRPITTAFAPCELDVGTRRGARRTPSGVPGTCAGVPARSRPALKGWKPSTSLTGSTARMTRPSSIWPGSGSWTRIPSTASSAFSSATSSSSSSSVVSAGQAEVARLDPDLARRPCASSGCRRPRPGRRRRARSRGRSGAGTRPPRPRPRRGSSPRGPSRPSASPSRAPE